MSFWLNCYFHSSTNVPVTLPSANVDTSYSTLNIPQSLLLTDVNVIDLRGSHTWITDLIITLYSPQGTPVHLFGPICGDEDDFWVSFDDTSSVTTLPCPPVSGGIAR